MQNFKDFPVWVKACFAIIIAAAAIAGFIELPKLTQQSSSETEANEALIEVEIIVETDNGQPIEGVDVRFISKGAPEGRRTNTDGFVRIEIPARDDIDITLDKQGFKTARHTINLNNDPNRTRTYRLLSEKP